MLRLSDFFQPLNFFTLSYFLFSLLFFDIIGTFFLQRVVKLKDNSEFRIVTWILGLGLFVFVWFLLSLFIPPTKENILISTLALFSVSAPGYFKQGMLKSLFLEIWKNKLAVMIILPFLPAVFVKASLPPYYGDEMAYHFIAPSALKNLGVIKYPGDIYADLPRILDFFWQQIFTVFHTYSIARLFHFSILSASMVFSYGVLKKNFGFIVGFLFVLIFFSLPQDIILTSTLGYIDVGAYSFLLIGLVSGIDFVLNKKPDVFILSLMFWAMNLGTKYTGVSAFVVYILILTVYVLASRKFFENLFTLRLFVKAFLVLIVFGGYWYIKNLVWYGNPIFPFIFNCWGTHIEVCPALGGFFGDWTTKITLANIPLIVKSLLAKNTLLQLLAVATPIFVIFTKRSKQKIVALLIYSAVLFELAMLKYFSGFYIRYQQHLQFYLIMSLLVGLSLQYKNAFLNFISKVTLLFLFLTSLYLYAYAVRNTNSLRFLNWNEINYSVGKISIHEWININFPNTTSVIEWCENPPNGLDRDLARFDPDLIWFDHDGLMRSFTTNCRYKNPPLQGLEPENAVKAAREQKMTFWIASTSKCIPAEKVVPKYTYERPDMLELRKLNNAIICNSNLVSKNLYYFDYSKI